MLIVGITGTNSSGKDTVADYFVKNYGFTSFSLSDEIREEATKRGITHERKNLLAIGNELRENFGACELAARVLKKIYFNPSLERVLVTSIRNPYEVDEFKKSGNKFVMIYVDADMKVRFYRAVKRGRIGDGAEFETFKEIEEKEMKGNTTGQQLLKCLEVSDYKIMNDGSIEELYSKLEKIAEEVL